MTHGHQTISTACNSAFPNLSTYNRYRAFYSMDPHEVSHQFTTCRIEEDISDFFLKNLGPIVFVSFSREIYKLQSFNETVACFVSLSISCCMSVCPTNWLTWYLPTDRIMIVLIG